MSTYLAKIQITKWLLLAAIVAFQPFSLMAKDNAPELYRRIVTGTNSQGKSIILFDSSAPTIKEFKGAGIYSTEIWETNQAPASNFGSDDLSAHEFILGPPDAGSRFRIVEILPEPENVSGDSLKGTGSHVESKLHPMMHATDSVDYIVILKGEIYAIVETGEVLLKAGDVFVQRGTAHAWANRSNKPCVFAAVLVDANPVKKGH